MTQTLTKPRQAPAYRRAPAKKRELILAAARVLFAAQGFDDTSTVQIAAKAGVSEGILFHHFGSKRGLFVQLAEAYAQEAAAATMSQDPADMTEESIVRGAFEFAERDPDLYRVFLEDGAKLDVDQKTDVIISIIRSNLERGMKEGLVRHGDAQVMAELQFAVVDGAYKAWLKTNNPSRKEDYIVEAIQCMSAMLSPPHP